MVTSDTLAPPVVAYDGTECSEAGTLIASLREALASEVEARKRTEQQLLRAQRLESIGMLASGIAHDLNNMLSPITMAVPLLRSTEESSSRDAILDIVETSAVRATEIVKQVLTFARGLSCERIPLKPADLVREMTRIAAETFPRCISVESRLGARLRRIVGDPTQLEQVLMNLCVNARDAMPDGGSLLLEAENLTVDEAYAAATPGAVPGPYVVFRVTDTGTGMSTEVAERIFEPFFTTKPPGKGTGLGLPTIVGIIKSHAGFLTLRSEIGCGSTFEVCLPAATDTAPTPPRPDAALPQGNGELILVVDDEPNIRKVTMQILLRHGYRALTAADGAEAVLVYARHADQIRVVLTDIVMPIIDGVALSRTLRKMNPQVRLIAFTGEAQNSPFDQLPVSEKIPCLTKPFTVEALVRAIHDAVVGK